LTVVVAEPFTLPSGFDDVKVTEAGVTVKLLTMKGIGPRGACAEDLTGKC